VSSGDILQGNTSVPTVDRDGAVLVVDANKTDTVAEDLVPAICLISHFSITSFIGGMVFAFGTIAILCFLRLFFQPHGDRYHTL